MVATYFSVWHFWVQRIWPHRHFGNCSEQLPCPFLGLGLIVRTTMLICCLPWFTRVLAKWVENDQKLLISAGFQIFFWVQTKWAIILKNVTNKHGLKCGNMISPSSRTCQNVTGTTPYKDVTKIFCTQKCQTEK